MIYLCFAGKQEVNMYVGVSGRGAHLMTRMVQWLMAYWWGNVVPVPPDTDCTKYYKDDPVSEKHVFFVIPVYKHSHRNWFWFLAKTSWGYFDNFHEISRLFCGFSSQINTICSRALMIRECCNWLIST